MTILTLDKVAVTGLRDAKLRQRALDRLRRVDPMQPGAPAEILIIRHLADPAPGALGRMGGVRAWENALTSDLAGMRARAVKPARGDLDSGAAAVLFADEAEMLACLAQRLASGHHGVWWARSLSRRLRPQHGPAAVFSSFPHLIPAIVEALSKHGTIASVLRSLTDENILQVLAQMGVSPSDIAEPIEVPSTVFADETEDKTTKALIVFLQNIMASIRVASYSKAFFVALAWTRRTHKTETIDTAVEIAKRAVVQSRTFAPKPGDIPSKNSPTEVSRHPDAVAHSNQQAASTSSGTDATQTPIGKTRNRPLQAPERSENTDALNPTIGTIAAQNSETALDIPSQNACSADKLAEQVPNLSPDGVSTEWGGVFFLCNFFVGALPARAPDLAHALENATREGDGLWSGLERLARALLPAIELDPVSQVLISLDARDNDLPATPEDADIKAAQAVSNWLQKAAWGDDGSPGKESFDRLFNKPARVFATAAHVDVVFREADISLPVRRAGLDIDPGWQPRFGRIIAFHYKDGMKT